MNILKSLYPVDRKNNLTSIEKIEKELGIAIYSDFKEILENYTVAKPLLPFFKKGKIEINLEYLFGFSNKEFEDFYSNYEIYISRIPSSMIPIGSIEGGDLLCMDNTTGEVYYWFHEEDDWGIFGNTKYPTKVSNNLSDFLNSLSPLEKPTQEEFEIALKSSTIKITPASVKIRNEQRAKKGMPPLTLEEWEKLLNS